MRPNCPDLSAHGKKTKLFLGKGKLFIELLDLIEIQWLAVLIYCKERNSFHWNHNSEPCSYAAG